MIIAKALNFKMATSSFVNVSEEVISAIEENSTAKSPKDAKKLTENLSKVRYELFADWIK